MDFLSSKDKRKLHMIQLFFSSNEGITRAKVMEELGISWNTLTNDIYSFNYEMNKFDWFLETNEQNLLTLSFPYNHSLATYEAVLLQNTILYQVSLATLDNKKITSVDLMDKYHISYSTLYREIKKWVPQLNEMGLSINMKEHIFIEGSEAAVRRFLYFFFTKVAASPAFDLHLYYKNEISNFIKVLEENMQMSMHTLSKIRFTLFSEIHLRRYLSKKRVTITPKQYTFFQETEQIFSIEEAFKQLPFELPIAEKIHFFAQFFAMDCHFSDDTMKKRIMLAKKHSPIHYELTQSIIDGLPEISEQKLALCNNILNFLDNYIFLPCLLPTYECENSPWTKTTSNWDNAAIEKWIYKQLAHFKQIHPDLTYLELDKDNITANIMAQIHAAYLNASYAPPLKIIVMSINGAPVESYFKKRILQHTDQRILFLDAEKLSQADIIISDYPLSGYVDEKKIILWNKDPSKRDWQNFDANARKLLEEQFKSLILENDKYKQAN